MATIRELTEKKLIGTELRYFVPRQRLYRQYEAAREEFGQQLYGPNKKGWQALLRAKHKAEKLTMRWHVYGMLACYLEE